MSAYVPTLDVRRYPLGPLKFYHSGRVYAVNPSCVTPGCGHVSEAHELAGPPYRFTRCRAPGCRCTQYGPGRTDLGPADYTGLPDDVIVGFHGGVRFSADLIAAGGPPWPVVRRRGRRGGAVVSAAAVIVTAWRVCSALRRWRRC